MLPLYILLIIIIIINFIDYEQFESINIYASRLFGMPKYILLNKFNRAKAIYISPPQPKVGESRCYKTICPKWIPDNCYCYKCI